MGTVFTPNTVIRSSEINANFAEKAPLASPTFTGTVTVPATITGPSSVVVTLPTTTSTLATLALAETLSSKTLTSPQINGLALAKSNKTGNYTLLLTDDIVTGDATSGAFTFTFPSAATSTNKIFVVKKTDSSFNAITLSGTGMTTNYLMTVGETAWFQSDGSAWVQILRKTDTGWITFTGTWTASSVNPAIGNGTLTSRWRRESDSIRVQYRISMGGTTTFGTGTYRFWIPNDSGWAVDTGKVATGNPGQMIGTLHANNGSSGNAIGAVIIDSAVDYVIAFTHGNANNVNPTNPITFASGNVLTLEFLLPITNFSA